MEWREGVARIVRKNHVSNGHGSCVYDTLFMKQYHSSHPPLCLFCVSVRLVRPAPPNRTPDRKVYLPTFSSSSSSPPSASFLPFIPFPIFSPSTQKNAVYFHITYQASQTHQKKQIIIRGDKRLGGGGVEYSNIDECVTSDKCISGLGIVERMFVYLVCGLKG